ncbi:MAG: sulfotransferase domain-containing protein, partial [Stellaceae bacterium]
LLDSGLLSHDDIDCLRPQIYRAIAAEAPEQRWIKAHDAYTLNRAGEPILGGNVAQAAIYLVRDPRDVAVSLAHHNNTTIDAAIDLMSAADGALCRGRKGLTSQLRQLLTGWSGHVTSWLDQTDVPVHWVRYEDLVTDPVGYFGAALDFAGRAASPTQIERAVRNASFAELQRQENAQGFGERMPRASAPFFRMGRVGGWHDALLPEQVARLEQTHGAVMRRLDYRVPATIDNLAMARA